MERAFRISNSGKRKLSIDFSSQCRRSVPRRDCESSKWFDNVLTHHYFPCNALPPKIEKCEVSAHFGLIKVRPNSPHVQNENITNAFVDVTTRSSTRPWFLPSFRKISQRTSKKENFLVRRPYILLGALHSSPLEKIDTRRATQAKRCGRGRKKRKNYDGECVSYSQYFISTE